MKINLSIAIEDDGKGFDVSVYKKQRRYWFTKYAKTNRTAERKNGHRFGNWKRNICKY
jgi:hypothetical protein